MRALLLFPALLVAGLALPAMPGGPTAAEQVPDHNCSFCHDLHGGSYSALRDTAVVEDLCNSCHGDLAPSTVDRDGVLVTVPQNGYGVHNGGKHTTPTGCWDCHNHEGEGGSNLALIQALMSTPNSGDLPVVFTSRTGANSFADSIPPFDGVCEVCHTTTNHHRNAPGYEAHHNAQTDCTTCHTHETGFGGGGACGDCHDTGGVGSTGPNGRRAVVPELSKTSHHAGGGYEDADCLVCHDYSSHQSGFVRLKGADGATVYDEQAMGTFRPESITAATSRSLSGFCLSCHDANGAGGNLTPFSDGLTVSDIDGSGAWDASAHATGEATNAGYGCMGDGSGTGCHGTGHGSNLASLLAPANGAPGAADVNQEEGFCYTCHDGSPTADMQTEFGRASHHDVDDSEQAAKGSAIECSSCHNPHRNSRARPLSDPDDTDTVWDAGDRDFCLRCHDGSPPSGVVFPGTFDGTGWNKSQYASSPHDASLSGNECQQCHEQHGSTRYSLLAANYVKTDFNQYSYNDGDYAACFSCHVEGDVVRDSGGGKAQNAFDDRHDRHVRSADSPCIHCHDAHTPYDAGEGLMNFEYAVSRMDADLLGRTQSTTFWISGSKGYCYLSCHTSDHPKPHKPKNYDRSPTDTERPLINAVVGAVGSNQLTVTFSEGVYRDSGGSGSLQVADFVLVDSDNGRTITGVSHTAGSTSAVLTLSGALGSVGDLGVDTVAPVNNQIWDGSGIAAVTSPVTIKP